jgi:serine/threonine-protein kinase
LNFLELIGRGGTAEVWRVVAADGREAALKVPLIELRRHPGAAFLIQHEHDVLRRVACKHIVELYELVEHDSAPALALEYLPNGDLVTLLGSAPENWLPAFRAAVEALLEAHRHGFAHGDVKARNVLFAADDTARLVDFSLARPLDSSAAVSTAAYSLPAGLRASARDGDCFALAALLFELSTGALPYGPAGPRHVADVAPVPAAEARAAPLVAAAVSALQAAGRVGSPGYFLDVIESV